LQGAARVRTSTRMPALRLAVGPVSVNPIGVSRLPFWVILVSKSAFQKNLNTPDARMLAIQVT
jgi:hypothetical protein